MTERVSSRVLYLRAITNTQEVRAAQTVTFQNKLRYDRKLYMFVCMKHTHCFMKKTQGFYWHKTQSVQCSETIFLSTWHYKVQLTGNVLPPSGLVRQHLLRVLLCPDEEGFSSAAVKWAIWFPIPSRQMTLQDNWKQIYFESRSGCGFSGANVKRVQNGS